MLNVSDIRQHFINELKNENFVRDKSGVKIIEMMGACFLADEDRIFGTPNEDYIKREIEWYESQSLYVKDIPGKTPEIWEKVSSREGKINSNYGYLIHSEENGSQFANVHFTLEQDRDSRRAIMIYTRPTMHYDYNEDGMSDFICTNTVQYLIRNNKLNAIVNMRSNDVVFGYNNDYAWQKHVLNHLADYLDIDTGDIIWQVGSLHVYERHFGLVK